MNKILVCGGAGCLSMDCQDVLKEFNKDTQNRQLSNSKNYQLIMTGCHGFCEQGPSVIIVEKIGHTDNNEFKNESVRKTLYCKVQPGDVKDIINEHITQYKVVERLLFFDPTTNKRIANLVDVPFYKYQNKLVLKDCGNIDPLNIEDYIQNGGYKALDKTLTMTPDQVINEVELSQLKGRGGGGFFTGRKWRSAQQAKGDVKYIVCNADEGDPGAFMDRSILEGVPHAVLEGMIIAGYAIGSNLGIIYVRAEYPLAVARMQIAIEQALVNGLLGQNIKNSSFDFDITIKQGAGAFVCGESSALMYSIEGKRGMPRPRPPNSTVRGLWDKPTCLNNVETFANIPYIINNGGANFATIGNQQSTGTKLLALTGKINNTGLVEVNMGTTLHDVVYIIGGGVSGKKNLKAVQTGGPSGGCIPANMLDLQIDFQELNKVGAMMGSGGLVVLDESACMVDLARYFLQFSCDESCGKCTPCREGTQQMLNTLLQITAGNGSIEDINTLVRLGEVMTASSLCGLGKSAANPVLSTIKYFRNEYEQHIIDKKCHAGVCKALLKYKIIKSACRGCLLCVKECPVDAITGTQAKPHSINSEKCIACGKCLPICPFMAIRPE